LAEDSKIQDEIKALGIVLAALDGLSDDGRKFVVSAVSDRLKIGVSVVSASLAASPAAAAPPAAGATGPATGVVAAAGIGHTVADHPRVFLKDKKPSSDVQQVAALAYFLTHKRDTPAFKTADISTLNTEAAGGELSNPSYAVNNALQAGLLAKATGGKKQLSPLGEELVVALPDQEAVKAALAAHRSVRGRKKASRKAKKGKKAS